MSNTPNLDLFKPIEDSEGWSDDVNSNFDKIDAGVKANTDAITVEAAARSAADTTESSARTSADTTLQTNITSEATSRASADTTLQTNITSEAGSRSSADTTLQTSITSEIASRASADTTLQTNIDAESTTRAAGDTSTLTTAEAYTDTHVATEASARTTADGLKEDKSNRGANNGYAPLDGSAKVPSANLPTAPVTTVAGRTGDVTLAESDITNLTTDLAGKQASLGFTAENIAHKDANNGYAGLDSSGLLKATEFPTPTTSAFGGIKDIAAATNKVVNAITNGIAQLVQLAFSNISGFLNLTTQVSGVLPAANGGLQSAPSSTTGLEGFFAGVESIWNFSRQSAAGNSFVTNNKVWVHRFTLSKPRVVGRISICVKTLLNPSTIDVGVYDSGKNLLFNLGGVSGATTGNKSVTLGAQVTLPAGDYYIAWTGTSSGTLSTLAVDGLDGSPALSVGLTTLLINVNGTRHGFAGNAATAGVLPSTLGTLTATNTTDAYPPLMFCEP